MKLFFEKTMMFIGVISTILFVAFAGFCAYLATTEDEHYDFD